MPTPIRLNKSEEGRLDSLAQKTGRTKAFYLRELVERGLQDLEDYYLATEVFKRVVQGQEEVLSSELVKKMHNPPHPGEFITDIFLEPHGISGRELALKLDVAPSTLSRILKGSSRVTPEMALRLSKAIGRSPESWLSMQDAHDLWVARQSVDLKKVVKLNLDHFK